MMKCILGILIIAGISTAWGIAFTCAIKHVSEDMDDSERWGTGKGDKDEV